MPNVPPLRFPEFSGEWEKCQLGETCTFFSGGTPTSSNKDYYDGGISFIRSGEINADCTELFLTREGFENSSAKMVEKGDLLLALYGATSGEIAISKINGAINQAILCIRSSDNNIFIKSVWEKHVQHILQVYLQGGQGNLSADIVKKLSFYFPLIEEQNKIAAFISLLDKRIATQIRVIEDLQTLKKAIIERSYNAGGKVHKIGELIEQVSKRNKSNDYPVLSVNNRLGFIEQADQFEDRTVASDDTSNYKVVSTNDFAYNPARINVGSIARLKDRTNGIVSPMYVCFHTKNTLLPEYMEYFFDTTYFKHEMFKRLEGSVRLCLSYEGLCNISMYIPSIDEQKKLSDRLSAIEQKIQLESTLLEKFKSQKMYLLQQMFI